MPQPPASPPRGALEPLGASALSRVRSRFVPLPPPAAQRVHVVLLSRADMGRKRSLSNEAELLRASSEREQDSLEEQEASHRLALQTLHEREAYSLSRTARDSRAVLSAEQASHLQQREQLTAVHKARAMALSNEFDGAKRQIENAHEAQLELAASEHGSTLTLSLSLSRCLAA